MDSICLDTYAKLTELNGRVHWTQWPADLKLAWQHAARILAAKQETPVFPPVVYIEPTNACNCNCVICPRKNMTRPVGYMGMDLFCRIVDSIADLGPSEILLFNFGEPTLHPDLAGMVRYCKNKGLSSSFQTNAIRVERGQLLALLEAGLDRIGVSVNGLNAEEYQTIRPGFSFEKVVRNLQSMRQIIAESGHACTIHIAAQALRESVAARPRDVDIFKRTWLPVADSLSIFGLSQYDRITLVNGGVVSETNLAAASRRPDAEVSCFEPFDRLIVKWDGRVTACCVDFDAQAVVGDLNRQDLREVWNSSAIRRLRDRLRRREFDHIPLCRTCPKFYSEAFKLYFQRTLAPKPRAVAPAMA